MKKIAPLILCLLLLTDAAYSQSTARPEETAKVYGRVVDASGYYPLEGAVLSFYKWDSAFAPAQAHLIKKATTNKDGGYSVNGLPWGSYMVVIELLGFATTVIGPLSLGSGDNLFDAGLAVGSLGGGQATEFSGVVRRDDRKPVEDATITVFNAFTRKLIGQIRTDKDGRFRLLRYSLLGQCILYAAKPGYTVNAIVVEKEDRGIELVLRRLPER